jgi:hypothetical protein
MGVYILIFIGKRAPFASLPSFSFFSLPFLNFSVSPISQFIDTVAFLLTPWHFFISIGKGFND